MRARGRSRPRARRRRGAASVRVEREDRAHHPLHLRLLGAAVAARPASPWPAGTQRTRRRPPRRDEHRPARLPDGERDAGICSDEGLFQRDGVRRVRRNELLDALEDRLEAQLGALPRGCLPPPVVECPDTPSAFLDDPVPASSRPWIDAENLHEERLGGGSDAPARGLPRDRAAGRPCRGRGLRDPARPCLRPLRLEDPAQGAAPHGRRVCVPALLRPGARQRPRGRPGRRGSPRRRAPSTSRSPSPLRRREAAGSIIPAASSRSTRSLFDRAQRLPRRRGKAALRARRRASAPSSRSSRSRAPLRRPPRRRLPASRLPSSTRRARRPERRVVRAEPAAPLLPRLEVDALVAAVPTCYEAASSTCSEMSKFAETSCTSSFSSSASISRITFFAVDSSATSTVVLGIIVSSAA